MDQRVGANDRQDLGCICPLCPIFSSPLGCFAPFSLVRLPFSHSYPGSLILVPRRRIFSYPRLLFPYLAYSSFPDTTVALAPSFPHFSIPIPVLSQSFDFSQTLAFVYIPNLTLGTSPSLPLIQPGLHLPDTSLLPLGPALLNSSSETVTFITINAGEFQRLGQLGSRTRLRLPLASLFTSTTSRCYNNLRPPG